uniref:Uncharacterized protein n=1 Tax=Rhizophora mucronata TaxID=61149 RepID=A0A2P2PHP5_RHIMU
MIHLYLQIKLLSRKYINNKKKRKTM